MKKKFSKFFEKSASRRTLVNVKFLCVVTDRQTNQPTFVLNISRPAAHGRCRGRGDPLAPPTVDNDKVWWCYQIFLFIVTMRTFIGNCLTHSTKNCIQSHHRHHH
jgi:hypothetical protein